MTASEIFSATPDINGKKILARITAITLRAVSYEIDGRKILENFSATFERGKIYCIVGANGAGKSTLLNLICGIIPATRGEIFFDGERRKVSIATAFEKFSDVLMMDEPDNNLYDRAVAALKEKIFRGKSNRITLIISHDERLIALADKTLSL